MSKFNEAKLDAGIWPVSEIDPSIIDPDGLYLPKDVCEVAEAQQDRSRGSKDLYQAKFRPPFSSMQTDWSTNINPRAEEEEAKGPVSKNAAANRDHAKDGSRKLTVIDSEYMNKEANDSMLESMSVSQLEQLLEAEVGALDDEDILSNIPPVKVSAIPNEEYNSAEDDEAAVALDTFEHAHQPPRPREGAIEDILPPDTESTSISSQPLTEAGKGELDRYFSEHPEAAQQDVKTARLAYNTWALDNGIEPAWGETFKRKHAIAGMPASSRPSQSRSSQSSRNAPIVLKEPVSSEELSNDFGDMLSHLDTATSEDLKTELSVDEKYSQILAKAYDWAKTPMEAYEKNASEKTSGSKRHLMVCGSPGVGKTFSVKEAVLKAVQEGIDFKTHYVRGTIGKSVSNVMAFLYRFRQGYLIIFDDCDDFLDSDLGNVMKGVFELDAPSTNTGSFGVRKLAMGMVDDLTDQPLEEANLRKYLMSSLFENDNTDDEFDEEEFDDEEVEEDDEESSEDDEAILPSRINFQSRILFISNKSRDRIDPAVRSRLSIVELYLKPEEIVDRIRKLLPQLLKNEKSVSDDRLQWAKLNALRWLELTIKAEGRPIEFPGGRTLLLPFDADRTVLEFRTYIDLVSGWLSQARRYERDHKGELLMKAKKLPVEFLRSFLMGELVPILRDASNG